MQCFQPIEINIWKKCTTHPSRALRYPVSVVSVPCGKCVACLSRRRQDWVFRNSVELEYAKTAYVATLTYDDEHLPWCDHGVTLNYADFQKFMKRLKITIARKVDAAAAKDVRFFLAGEYGDQFGRPHYHVILYNLPLANERVFNLEFIDEIWNCGGVYLDEVNGSVINYVSKYTMAKVSPDWTEGCVPPFMHCSQSLGMQLLEDVEFIDYVAHQSSPVVKMFGSVYRLPRLYKERLCEIIDGHKSYDAYRSGIEKQWYENAVVQSEASQMKYDRRYYDIDKVRSQRGLQPIFIERNMAQTWNTIQRIKQYE